MKKKIFLLVTILLMSVSATAQENWNSFNSEMGKFSIDFYGDVTQSERIKEESKTYKAQVTLDGMSVMVSSSKHIKSLEGRKDLLYSSLDLFNESLKGTIVSKEEIEDNGIKGVYAFINLDNGNVLLEYKIYNNGYYQYQIAAYAQKDLYNQLIADRCFNSFKIVD